MFKRIIRNKKGVAEVIGSLMIILIVAIAGTIVYAYSLNAIGTSSSNLNNQATQNEQLAQERFEIISVWSNNQKNELNLTVLNYGQTDLTLIAVYINGTAVTKFISGNAVTIGVNQLSNVIFTSPLVLNSGSCVQILAVSGSGGKNTVLYET